MMPSDAVSPPASHRSHTLRVVDLLSTQVQSVRIELVGTASSTFTRVGAVLLYLPLLLVGYLLILASVMKLFAALIGWGLTCFIFGAVHLAFSAWGISRGRAPGAARTYDVVDPEVVVPAGLAAPASAPAPTQAGLAQGARAATADTLPDLRRRAAEAAARRPSASSMPARTGAAAADLPQPHPVPQAARASGSHLAAPGRPVDR